MICICGHAQSVHQNGAGVCQACFDLAGGDTHKYCTNFKPSRTLRDAAPGVVERAEKIVRDAQQRINEEAH